MFNRRIETDFQMRALPSSVRSTEPGISFRIISVEQVLFVRIRVIAIGCIEIRWEFGNVLKWVCLVNSTTDKIEMAKNELKPSDSESYLKCYHNSYGWFRMPSQMARVTSLRGFTCITTELTAAEDNPAQDCIHLILNLTETELKIVPRSAAAWINRFATGFNGLKYMADRIVSYCSR